MREPPREADQTVQPVQWTESHVDARKPSRTEADPDIGYVPLRAAGHIVRVAEDPLGVHELVRRSSAKSGTPGVSLSVLLLRLSVEILLVGELLNHPVEIPVVGHQFFGFR